MDVAARRTLIINVGICYMLEIFTSNLDNRADITPMHLSI